MRTARTHTLIGSSSPRRLTLLRVPPLRPNIPLATAAVLGVPQNSYSQPRRRGHAGHGIPGSPHPLATQAHHTAPVGARAGVDSMTTRTQPRHAPARQNLYDAEQRPWASSEAWRHRVVTVLHGLSPLQQYRMLPARGL